MIAAGQAVDLVESCDQYLPVEGYHGYADRLPFIVRRLPTVVSFVIQANCCFVRFIHIVGRCCR